MKVLIVDQVEQIRQMVRQLVQELFPGAAIEEAANRQATYLGCAMFRPDLLIIDSYAPTMNGAQTLAELKLLYPHLIVIVFTDFTAAEQRHHCLEAGADALLQKGEPRQSLGKTITRAWQAGPTVGAVHHKRGRHELITGYLSYEQAEHGEHLIVLQMNQVRREELLTTYDELLRHIWQSTLPILGCVMLLGLAQRTYNITRQQHSFISELSVTQDGFNLYELADDGQPIDPDELRKGLQALVTNFILILSKLVSNCMARRLLQQGEAQMQSV